jgi:hypothetical protein
MGDPILLRECGLYSIRAFAVQSVGYALRDWQESVGDQLKRECGSIIDAAGEPRLRNVEIMGHPRLALI